jgi:hypothetical protein
MAAAEVLLLGTDRHGCGQSGLGLSQATLRKEAKTRALSYRF